MKTPYSITLALWNNKRTTAETLGASDNWSGADSYACDSFHLSFRVKDNLPQYAPQPEADAVRNVTLWCWMSVSDEGHLSWSVQVKATGYLSGTVREVEALLRHLKAFDKRLPARDIDGETFALYLPRALAALRVSEFTRYGNPDDKHGPIAQALPLIVAEWDRRVTRLARHRGLVPQAA